MQPTPEDKKPEVKEEVKVPQPEQVKQEVPPPPPPATDEEINWRKFREERAKERKQKEEMERQLAEEKARAEAMKQALEAMVSNKSTQPIEQSSQVEIDDNDIPTGSQIKSYVQNKISRGIQEGLKSVEEQLARKKQQEEAAQTPVKLKQTFSDFDRVCTAENLDYLEYHYPEVASALTSVPDSYDKWANVYKAVRRFVPNIDKEKELAKAQINSNKPQSMSSPGMTQTGDEAPRMLDDRRKDENWKRMQRIMRGG